VVTMIAEPAASSRVTESGEARLTESGEVRLLDGGVGFDIAGQDAVPRYGYSVVAEAQTYTLTGSAAAVSGGVSMAAEVGTFAAEFTTFDYRVIKPVQLVGAEVIYGSSLSASLIDDGDAAIGQPINTGDLIVVAVSVNFYDPSLDGSGFDVDKVKLTTTGFTELRREVLPGDADYTSSALIVYYKIADATPYTETLTFATWSSTDDYAVSRSVWAFRNVDPDTPISSDTYNELYDAQNDLIVFPQVTPARDGSAVLSFGSMANERVALHKQWALKGDFTPPSNVDDWFHMLYVEDLEVGGFRQSEVSQVSLLRLDQPAGTGVQLNTMDPWNSGYYSSLTSGAASMQGATLALQSVIESNVTTLSATTRNFVVTAQQLAGLQVTAPFPADSYTFTGADAQLSYTKTLAAEAQSNVLTGGASSLTVAWRVAADTQSFALAQLSAGLGAAGQLATTPGVFELAGQEVGASRSVVVTAGAQSYTLSGQVAALTVTAPADTQSYTLTGQDTTFRFGVAAQVSSFSATGTDVVVSLSRKVSAGAQSYALVGQHAALQASGTIAIVPEALTLTGYGATFEYMHVLEPVTARYQVAWQAVDTAYAAPSVGRAAYDNQSTNAIADALTFNSVSGGDGANSTSGADEPNKAS